MQIETIRFDRDKVFIIDQTYLPNKFSYIELNSLDDVVSAIKNLKVRGAPAIGITAAYGFYVHAKRLMQTRSLTKESLLKAVKRLENCRPTAKNLSWAVRRMYDSFLSNQNKPAPALLDILKQAAIEIHDEDRLACSKIGAYGNAFIEDGSNVLTHCNAGILATGGIGTALAPVYTAFAEGKKLHVYVDETRPVGQGARLTYWELEQHNIPCTLITDNMAGFFMGRGKIDLICVGADRIVSNGDVANKIGTYSLAVLADYHKIPFYVLAPLSTFDLSLSEGSEIPIENRAQDEITDLWNIDKGLNYKAENPAFDVTPHNLISAIITDKGIIHKPCPESVSKFFYNIT